MLDWLSQALSGIYFAPIGGWQEKVVRNRFSRLDIELRLYALDIQRHSSQLY